MKVAVIPSTGAATEATTDVTGAYNTGPLDSGPVKVTVSRHTATLAEVYDQVTVDLASDTTENVTLPATVPVEVKVFDTDARPVSTTAKITAKVAHSSTTASFSTGQTAAAAYERTATPNLNGVATLDVLAGTGIVDVTPTQHQFVPTGYGDLPFAPDFSITVVVHTLAGALNTAGGVPLEGQAIKLLEGGLIAIPIGGAAPQRAVVAATTTGSHGAYALTAPVGDYMLRVAGGEANSSVLPASYSVDAPLDLNVAHDQHLTLPASSLTVRVVDGDGAPVPGAAVAVRCSPTQFALAPGVIGDGTVCDDRTTDASGIAVARVLPSNGLTVAATPPAGSGLSAAVHSGVVVGDSGATLTIVVPRITTLRATPALIQLSPLALPLLNLTATLKSGAAGLAGRHVSFNAGTTTICTSLTDADGLATCSAAALPALVALLGSNGYTAIFSGDGRFVPSHDQAALIG